ncbi:hypothetical protein KM043_000320 [Ampulex compressa]|nr:hypothetical protein KM043_000320 [Ampulex compressa]
MNGEIDKNPIKGSVILDSTEIESRELETVKGDAIGDTVYSAKWIMNTIISLSKVVEDGWTTELENDLCTLWDMTTEADVVRYLMENEFLRVTELVLRASTEPRLTEIIVGIIGNMCCQRDVVETLGKNKEFCSTLLSFLSSDDTETLIQILRLLQAAIWEIQRNTESVWSTILKECTYLDAALSFILQSSTNDALLNAAISLVRSVSLDTDLLKATFKPDDLLPAMVEAFVQINPKDKEIQLDSNFEFIDNWLTALTTIMKNFEFEDRAENIDNITNILSRVLLPYRGAHNLISIDESAASRICECVEISLALQRNGIFQPEVNSTVATIMFNLQAATKDYSNTDSDDVTGELGKYLKKYWRVLTDIYSNDQITEVLRTCDPPTIKFMMELEGSSSRVSYGE